MAHTSGAFPALPIFLVFKRVRTMFRLIHWLKSMRRSMTAVENFIKKRGSGESRRGHLSRPGSRRPLTWRPALEILEDRVTPSNWLVSLSTPDSAATAGTLRYALTQAANGDTITFASTLSGSTITVNGVLTISHNVTITGLGAANLAISGSNVQEDLWVNSGVTASISSLKVENGHAFHGGGIDNFGTLSLTNCILTGNSATSSGGAIWSSGSVSLSNCTLSSNSAARGAAIYNTGSMTLTSTTISGNTATQNGGGINNSGTMSLNNSTVSGNSGGYGGGFFNYSGTLTLSNSCTVSNNTATQNAGGIDNNSGATLSLSNSTVSGNSAPHGGAMWTQGTTTLSYATLSTNSGTFGGAIDNFGSLNVANSTLSGNTASSSGGGIWSGSSASLVLSSSTLSGNSAQRGGGIWNGGTATLTNGTLSTNTTPTTGGGGGIDNSGPLTLNNSTLSSNTSGFGAGIDNFGTLTLNNSTLSGNAATYSGGGIWSGNNNATVSLSNSTLTGNSGHFGGGVYNYSGTLALSNNSTVTSNTCTSKGGGIYNNTLGTLNLSNSTVSTNSAHLGGGIDNFGLLTLTGTTVSGNTASISGAGINNGGTVTLSDSTVSGNSAPSVGGINNDAGTVTLSNSTVFGNSATTLSGGGIWSNGTLTLSNSTVAGNSALLVGGGIDNSGGTLTLLNSIVAGNTAGTGPNVGGNIALANHDLIANTSGMTITSGTGNLLNVSAGLASALANNGGPTQTLALALGSAAIRAGGALTSIATGHPVGTADTTIYVPRAADIAVTAGNYYIRIGQEDMLVTNVSMTANTLTVQRGVNGTTAATHAVGASVYLATDQCGTTRAIPPDIGAFQRPPAVTASTAALPVTAATLTINGSGFDTTPGNDAVTFDNGVTGAVTSASSTSITVSLTGLGAVSGGTALDASVTVDGVSSGSLVQVATVVVAPAVTSLSPATGSASGGTSVVITGTGFTGATAVNFGAAAAPSFLVNSDTSITATSPAGSGVVDVAVVTAGGTSATSSADQFTYLSATTTTLTSTGPNPSNSGQAVSFTATVVSGSAIDGETITIEDADANNAIVASPTLSGGTVTFTISDLSVGTHDLFAVYGGDAANAGSNSSLTPVTQIVHSAGPAPSVSSVVVNGGAPAYLDANSLAVSLAGQNSVVEQILVTFNEAVTLDPGAFTITNDAAAVTVNNGPSPNTDAVSASFTAVAGSGDTQFIVTFSGAGTTAIPGGMGTVIKDGLYILNTVGSHIHANGQTAADNNTTFWALYGSAANDNVLSSTIGDGASEVFVDNFDYSAFKNTFGSESDIPIGPPAYNAALDGDLNGFVDNFDYSAFKSNFGADWAF